MAEGEETGKARKAKPEADPAPENSEDLRLSRRVSWVLDEFIRIPGTNIRFGLDPILGLIPYGGETAATMMGTTILGEAGKRGLPLRTLIKMSGNMLLNAAVGVIPFVGDLFSVWFKSNSRNYQLLNTFLESEDGEQAQPASAAGRSRFGRRSR